MKSKGQNKVEVFREGESEEYNSEVDGEEINVDEFVVNYDILGVRDGECQAHQVVFNLVMKYEELPEDWEEQLTYENRRKHHQRLSDEKWREKVERIGPVDEPIPRPIVDVNDITRDFLTSD